MSAISALLEQPLLLLGAGREGLATLAVLRARGRDRAIGVVSDQPAAQLPEGAQAVDPEALDTLDPATLVVRSPGFAPLHPLRQAIDRLGLRQTTATRLMLQELGAAGITVAAITASKGKSTVSSLTRDFLAASGVATELVGNIGVPALSRLDTILRDRPVVVIELSSYQCDDLEPGDGPGHAGLGTLFPEHLDWHGSLSAYYAAKARLPAAMPGGSVVHLHAPSLPVLHAHGLDGLLRRADLEVELVNQAAGLHLDGQRFMDGARVLGDAARMRVPGRHNRENACLAFAIARRLGAQPARFESVVESFGGLPFRLQDEGLHGGVRWINDSISTAPEAACAALEAFGGQVHTLIAGGQDRGYDYATLARALVRWQVAELVLLPESGQSIAHAAAGCGSVRMHEAGNLAAAVEVARRLTPPGRICLFSPAAPSYHAWSGFEARGADYRMLLQALD